MILSYLFDAVLKIRRTQIKMYEQHNGRPESHEKCMEDDCELWKLQFSRLSLKAIFVIYVC